MILSVMVLIAPVAQAASATMSLSTDVQTIQRGQTFDVVIGVNPNGEELDTARAVITFTPGVLSIEDSELTGSFNRTSPGNSANNSTGKLSLGGFTLEGPITRSGEYARASFRAQQTGTATITVSPDSRLISAGEEKIDTAFVSSVEITVEDAQDDQEVARLAVSSDSHKNPAIWYSNNTVDLSWEVNQAGATDLTGFYVTFDQQSDTDPTVFVSASTLSRTYSDVEDGVWYFHIKGQHENGKQTKTVHRRVAVDTTPPNELAVTFSYSQLLETETTEAFFGTTDDTSGVLYYEAAINRGAFEPHVSPLTLGNMPVGTYFVEVKAIDKAGNEIFGSNTLRVYPKGTELIRPEETEKSGLTNRMKILITVVLGALILFTIIYGIKKRKN